MVFNEENLNAAIHLAYPEIKKEELRTAIEALESFERFLDRKLVASWFAPLPEADLAWLRVLNGKAIRLQTEVSRRNASDALRRKTERVAR